MVPRKRPTAYSRVISLPKLTAVMLRPLVAKPTHRIHARTGDNSPTDGTKCCPSVPADLKHMKMGLLITSLCQCQGKIACASVAC